MLKDAFIDGKKVIMEIEKNNHQAYFVGGCVRDLLLDRSIGDIDIATSASPKEVQQMFPQVIPVGIEHGTVIVRYNHVSYEVTTFRLDGTYTDQRHPDSVQFLDRIDQDLQRRDFTINALAMDKDGIIIDLFEGEKDLNKKVIRTVGNGYDRFTEDPLRIIRALRFSSQLGFSIEKKTLSAIQQTKKQIENIAIERITNEFSKLFSGVYISQGIFYLKCTEIDSHLPILSEHPHIIKNLPNHLERLSTFGEVLAHFHYLKQTIPISKWVKAWKCSNLVKREAIALIKAIVYYEQYGLDEWLVYQLDEKYYGGLIRLIQNLSTKEKINLHDLTTIKQQLTIHSKQDLSINGTELIELFPNAPRGPWINEVLMNIEKEVVFNRLKNTKMNIKEWITCNPPVIN
jgi:tRNA nucleotidyltransferase (CCA-adding enzyme)